MTRLRVVRANRAPAGGPAPMPSRRSPHVFAPLSAVTSRHERPHRTSRTRPRLLTTKVKFTLGQSVSICRQSSVNAGSEGPFTSSGPRPQHRERAAFGEPSCVRVMKGVSIHMMVKLLLETQVVPVHAAHINFRGLRVLASPRAI